eukprot:GHVU01063592.1.p1 GENE.GHVU01063592.1~~GHVU01063592.1.p1  ORF type:complete len:106 (+),score=17.80 GHVU01063592.1:366-683(+)
MSTLTWASKAPLSQPIMRSTAAEAMALIAQGIIRARSIGGGGEAATEGGKGRGGGGKIQRRSWSPAAAAVGVGMCMWRLLMSAMTPYKEVPCLLIRVGGGGHNEG